MQYHGNEIVDGSAISYYGGKRMEPGGCYQLTTGKTGQRYVFGPCHGPTIL